MTKLITDQQRSGIFSILKGFKIDNENIKKNSLFNLKMQKKINSITTDLSSTIMISNLFLVYAFKRKDKHPLLEMIRKVLLQRNKTKN